MNKKIKNQQNEVKTKFKITRYAYFIMARVYYGQMFNNEFKKTNYVKLSFFKLERFQFY